jgi:NAD(P)-dependent dehydrogenase (short-subunit alcohol dehydrogenase family)
MNLEGRVALVTGGGRGIGKGIALALAEDGAGVAVNWRKDEASAVETVAEIEALGGKAKAYQAAIDAGEAASAMVDAVIADFGFVDILVNSAGIASRGNSVLDTAEGEVEHVVAVHAFGPYYMSRAVLPSMRTQPRGDIIFISSVATATWPGWSVPYNMGKGAVEALAFTLAREEQRNGIRVNVVAPGLVVSEMGKRLAKATRGVDDIHELDAKFPYGRVCTPEDVAGVVRWLVSDHGSYVNGQRIYVDGGAH